MTSRAPRYRTLVVTAGFTRYRVEAAIWPARAPAHVGADSPRFGDVGAPAFARIIRVYRGAQDVTGALDESLMVRLHAEVERQAGIASGPREREEQALMEFAR